MNITPDVVEIAEPLLLKSPQLFTPVRHACANLRTRGQPVLRGTAARRQEAEPATRLQLAELDAEIASREAQTRELVAGREIREALIAGGVSSGLVSGATKYLLAQFDITLTKDGDDFRATVADS